MSNGKIVKPPNLGYYCGAKFDTIPTLSILPPLPNHWRSSESKSTPSSPVPLSYIHASMTTSGSSTPSGRSTVPVLKATSLPTAAGHGHDIKTSFTKMKMVKVRDNISNRAESEPETKGQTIYDAKGLPQKGKRRGRVPKKEQAQTTPAPVHSGKVASSGSDTNTNTKKTQIVNSSEGGYILMAMLQSGKEKTETENVPRLVQPHNAQSTKVKSPAESLTKSNTTSTQYQLYGSCQQFEQNEDSSKLKALLKVCT